MKLSFGFFYINIAKELGIYDELIDFNDHQSLGIPKEYTDQHYESIAYSPDKGVYPKNGYGLVECIKENRFVAYIKGAKQVRIKTLEEIQKISTLSVESYIDTELAKLRSE